jgi:hypothetical protein
MKSTVLVLGAGASRPYGFPTGYELRQRICNELKDSSTRLSTQLCELVAPPDQIRQFRDEFERSQIYSIDRFLGNRPQWANIGKAAIAVVLAGHEILHSLFAVREDHWYQYLWNQIATSWDALASTNLSFITFNYDRSLEYFLLEAMKHSFGKSQGECIAQLATIPITHVYGMIGEVVSRDRRNTFS